MRPLRWFVAFLVLLVTVSPAPGQQSVEDALRSELLNKVLTIRNFYSGHDLHFNSQGALTSAENAADFASARLQIEKVELRHDKVVLQGTRFKVINDPVTKTMVSTADSKGTKLQIDLPFPKSDVAMLNALLEQVFLTKKDILEELAPEEWKTFIHDGTYAASVDNPVYKVGNEVKPPRAIETSPPTYPQQARALRDEGASLLWVIIGADGLVKDARVVRGAGHGLDERAVEAVRHWKFSPATKNGVPVAVQLNVEVNFKLF
jgi:TonB family protein